MFIFNKSIFFYNPYLKVIDKSMFAYIVNNTLGVFWGVDSAEIIMCFFLSMYIRI
jgi:hypothetical protein